MREAMFIKKNADKWQKYQHEKIINPDETADRFVTLIDDLSYAKTFYPKSKVTYWINGITANIYQNIYQNKKEKSNRIFQFWKFELPLLFKQYHRILLFTFIAFVLFVCVGVFSSIHNPDFIKGVLGDDYVRMTEDNIDKGDPFGVYNDGNPFTMFVQIAFNNIKVAFMAFIGGFTLGYYTLKIMWSNGLMLGVFQYLFFAKDLGIKSILVIWIHGTLEISAIVISCTAGFVLASGVLFPGTYTRMYSFKKSAKDAAKILISLIPVFIVAAFFESYITHLMSQSFSNNANGGMPIWSSIVILILSLSFIIWYFIILPIKIHKKGYQLKTSAFIHRLKND